MTLDLIIDIDSPALSEYARIAATVVLPHAEHMRDPPIVCFAKPAGSYARAYFTLDLPGPGEGAQAQWHAERGWIFVALDNIGTGQSSRHSAADLTLATVCEINARAEKEILLKLANGMISPSLPPVIQPITIGLGHSLGACLTIAQQAHHACYDGIAVLGYGVYHNQPPTPPGEPPIVVPWFSRDVPADQPGGILNLAAVQASRANGTDQAGLSALQWSSYFDDVPDEVVATDVSHYEYVLDALPSDRVPALPWVATGIAGMASRSVLTPGIVAPESAAISVPVLLAMGERDFIAEPGGEPRAFRSSDSVDLFICPRMGHMHNFASTRELLWRRIDSFGAWCEAAAEARRSETP